MSNQKRWCALPMAETRKVSNEWLLGVTAGGYITSVAFYCFGRGLLPKDDPFRVSTLPYSLDSHALLFLVSGIIVCALSVLQIYFEKIFKRAMSPRAARVAVSLNALGIVCFCCGVVLEGAQELDGVGGVMALVAIVLFFCGILLSVSNVIWAIVRNRPVVAHC